MPHDNRVGPGRSAPSDRALLDGLPVGMMVHHHGLLTYANQRFADIVGRSCESLIGMPFTDLVTSEEAGKLTERYARRLRGRAVPTEYETICERPDGSRCTLALSVSSEGAYVTAIVRDVTDRVERRERRFSLAHLGARIAAQNTPQGIYHAVREGLQALGLGSALLVPDGEILQVAWVHWPNDTLQRFVDATGIDPQKIRVPNSPFTDRVWSEGEAYADDAVSAIASSIGGVAGEVAGALTAEVGLFRSVAARIVIGDERIGVIVAVGEWLREDDLASVHLLGEQIAGGLQNARLLAGAQRRLHDLESLHGLARRVLAATTEEPRALVVAACESLAGALDARWVAAYMLSEDSSSLRWTATWSEGGRTAIPDLVPLSEHPELLEIVQGAAPVVLADTRNDVRSCVRGVRHVPHGAAVVFPVRSHRGALGLVTVASIPERSFADAEVAVAGAMVALVGLGLENAELLAEVRRRLREMSLVFGVGRTIAGSLDLQCVLDEGCEAIRTLLDASNVFVMLYDASKEEIRGAGASAGVGVDFLEVRQPLAGPGLAAEAVRTRKTFVSEDAANDPRINATLLARYNEKSLLVVPLMRGEEPVGVVVVDECRHVRRFTEAEIERTVLISNQLAVAIDNARLHDETRQSYRELAEAQAKLVQREKLAALGELAAVIAHEVRNPLGVIFNSLGTLGRVLSVTPGSDGALLLGILQEEAHRLNHIVGDLLDFARPVRPAVSPERLDKVLDEALTAAMSGEDAACVELAKDLPDDLAPVMMDARLVRQAVLNIAHNALQAMPSGGRLSVSARTEGPWARIDVTDTGPGIGPEVMNRIFEPFFTTKAKGTGLGLAVVKRIVEGHGGALDVVSTPGQGTRFTVRLPLNGDVSVA